ncbi:MAG: helix-turn-helix domain-containing protein [Deltaproteobacteria bacterium]|nr:helix-turn-helix domain-containing protein [Deltaproteobacteria bacterium]MBW2151785.1 helix-turn-helix domain-containing protein [Deltaproteobacteria bacterium]
MSLLTTKQAAQRLGVSTARIRAMILAGRLKAKKFSRVWVIRKEALKAVENRKPGRPPKKRKGKE